MLEIMETIINILIVVGIVGLIVYAVQNRKSCEEVIETILNALDNWLDNFF